MDENSPMAPALGPYCHMSLRDGASLLRSSRMLLVELSQVMVLLALDFVLHMSRGWLDLRRRRVQTATEKYWNRQWSGMTWPAGIAEVSRFEARAFTG